MPFRKLLNPNRPDGSWHRDAVNELYMKLGWRIRKLRFEHANKPNRWFVYQAVSPTS